MSAPKSSRWTRRAFAASTLALGSPTLGAGWLRTVTAAAIARRAEDRPQTAQGVMSGEARADSAVVWSRSDRPARMIVEYATTDAFRDVKRIIGPAALEDSDFTARMRLRGLPVGQTIHYRVLFEDLACPGRFSLPVSGRFRTPSPDPRDVLFAWSGDTVGQGYGIDLARGGMTIYETMRRLQPDFFVHSGDTIYADNPLVAEMKLDDGTIWRNIVTPEKSKVAETLAEFRGNHRYNLIDDNVRRFNAETPLLVQWDDHETTNNWYPTEILPNDGKYRERSCALLSARAKRAFFEYVPTRHHPDDPERIYRSIPYNPQLEVFLLDLRSYRGPNDENRQLQATPLMGPAQTEWLKRRLKASTATWKVIASDMPIGLIVGDGPKLFENVANGSGPPLGRELELADLLRFVKRERIRNLVWLTADVHYAAAHYYDPAKAKFADFDPFWEFVAGPLHAGTFGPGTLDDTFGPEVKFNAIPRGLKPNRPPSEGYQFFGTVKINARDAVMTVALWNAKGDRLYSVDLAPIR